MATKLDLVFNALTEKAQAAVGALLSSVNKGLATATASTQQATAATRTYGDTSATQLRRAGQEVNKLDSQWDQLIGTIKMGVGIDIGGKIVGAIQQIPAYLKQAVTRGVEFNSLLENSRLGLAATFKTFQKDIKDFDEALRSADMVLESLKSKAMESPAELRDLVSAYQGLAPAMFAANVPLAKQADLVVMMSQALAGMNIRPDQLLQEANAILTGNITPDARAAKLLSITRQAMEEAAAQGRTIEYLEEKMGAFAEAAKRGANTWTQLVSNLFDKIDQTLGKATEGVFDTIKKLVVDLSTAIGDPRFLAALNSISGGLEKIIGLFGKLGITAVENIDYIIVAVQMLIVTLTALLATFAAMKFAALFGGFALGLALIGDLIIAFKLLLWHMLAVLAAGGLISFTVILAGAVGGIYAGVEAWKAWKAAQEEALAVGNLVESQKNFAQTLLKTIEARRMAGELDATRADELVKSIESVMAKQDKRGTEPQFVLMSIARELIPDAEKKVPTGEKENTPEVQAHRELMLKRVQMEMELKKAQLDQERELVQRAYDDQRIKLEEFIAKRKELVTAAYEAERNLLRLTEASLKQDRDAEKDPAKKRQLQAEVEAVQAQLRQLALKHEGDLSAVTREGELKRREIRDKAAEQQRDLLNKIADDHRQATFTKVELLEYEYQEQVRRIERTVKDEEDKNIALLQLRKTYQANKARIDAEADIKNREKELKAQRDEIATERARVQNSFLLTNVQKRKQEIELLEREEKATRAIVEQLQEKARLAREAGNEAAAAAYDGQVGQYEDQARGLGAQRAGIQAQADPESIRQQMMATIIELDNQLGTTAQRIAGMFRDVVGSAIDGISTSIGGLIRGTMSWGQALSNIGTTIMDTVINAFARMIAEQIIKYTILDRVKEMFSAREKARHVSEAAAKAPNALLESITTWGIAAAIGGAAFLAAMALAGGFKEGGFTGFGDPNQVAGVVHKGEFVIPAPVVRAIGLDRLQPLADGMSALGGLAPRGLGRVGAQPINMRGAATNVNVAPSEVHFAVIKNAQEMKEFLSSAQGRKIVVDHVKGSKTELGIQT